MLTISGVSISAAFLAGAISFLSPCCLPLVPGYVSFIAGQPELRSRRSVGFGARLRALGLSACFVLGFSTVLVALGAGASVLGSLLLSWRAELNLLGGAVIILFGLMMLGLFRLPVFARDTRFQPDIPGGRPMSAYLLGLAFAFGWTPCIGPILGAILTLSADSGSLQNGVWLLAIYSLGLGLPFLLTALFTDVIAARIKTIGRAGRGLYVLSGAIMVAMGLAVMTGNMTRMAYWLLETFPILNFTLV
ncbi:MAG TPA: cytochrome c biogenesis protein CcdA [Albidovulum sp.]|uniref:cytochrome c biogenesis CcdA family protein n=1 Tax=Albidovulum sp. TaxID=1872424 RepID=UPI002CD43D08|nr:cytochrome c biogenesis protein CcdA [Albidovulum sp.]